MMALSGSGLEQVLHAPGPFLGLYADDGDTRSISCIASELGPHSTATTFRMKEVTEAEIQAHSYQQCGLSSCSPIVFWRFLSATTIDFHGFQSPVRFSSPRRARSCGLDHSPSFTFSGKTVRILCSPSPTMPSGLA